MTTEQDKLKSAIWMLNHYKKLAKDCFDIYPDIADAYLCYDHYMLYVKYYREIVIELLYG